MGVKVDGWTQAGGGSYPRLLTAWTATDHGLLMGTAAAFVAGAVLGGAVVGDRRRVINFHGRSVVISGGSRGRGLALARRMARDGARVAILGRNFAELTAARDRIAKEGGEVYALPCDVSRRDDRENAMKNVARRFGGIDLVIHSKA